MYQVLINLFFILFCGTLPSETLIRNYLLSLHFGMSTIFIHILQITKYILFLNLSLFRAATLLISNLMEVDDGGR